MFKKYFVLTFVLFIILHSACLTQAQGIKVGTFSQETRQFYTPDNGLPGENANVLAVGEDNVVYAGFDNGLAIYKSGKWTQIKELQDQSVRALAYSNDLLVAFTKGKKGKDSGDKIYFIRSGTVTNNFTVPKDVHIIDSPHALVAVSNKVYLAGESDLYEWNISKRNKIKLKACKFPGSEIRQFDIDSKGEIWLAAKDGLYRYDTEKAWNLVYPVDGDKSWAPIDVHGVAFDQQRKIWFASPQGVGCLNKIWSLFTGKEGLPYNDFTCAATGGDGAVWFGTHKGAIRYDGQDWEYRQGKRWLPDDDIKDIAVDSQGNAWFATEKGVGVIKREPTTLAEKAKWYEDEIDLYHRRTPYGYVLEVSCKHPGDKTRITKHDSDNDGLWTSMYGAGECFAYAATKDLKAKERAQNAFEALHFLGKVTQGGSHPAPAGFVARTILPTSGHDPNIGRIERDKQHKKERDKLWKIIDPRWPVSEDGKWYWKTDTSSDELDGHYFFYAQYYDLVADTESEKSRIRKHVKALTDHLIEHDFILYDHDNKPTRWSRFSPKEINFDKDWFVERGLNSLSMLSYLKTTEHITGDPKYGDIANDLIENHSYMQNLIDMKFQRGIGTGNQSDDEMAFMCYYNLLKYETDPERRSVFALSFWNSWRLEQLEMNPFFNFAFAASCTGESYTDAFGTASLDPTGDWLEDSIETLKRFPLDRFDWRHENSHRIDLLHFEEWQRAFDDGSMSGKGRRVNGKVIPVDECHFNHWNRDSWRLDTGGSGRGLADGTVFLLPYYMGLYHGFVVE